MPLNDQELLTYYDKLNNELNTINHMMKTEKDPKRVKTLSNQSDLINNILNKLNSVRVNNEKLNKK
jgi:hypothetical protein